MGRIYEFLVPGSWFLVRGWVPGSSFLVPGVVSSWEQPRTKSGGAILRAAVEFGSAKGGVSEVAHHAGDGARASLDLRDFTVQLFVRNVVLIECDNQCGFKFSARPLGNGQKAEEFAIPIPFEAFRNVEHDRCGASLGLIDESEISPKLSPSSEYVDVLDDFSRKLPADQVPEAPNARSFIVLHTNNNA
jgi:hypothetical protein